MKRLFIFFATIPMLLCGCASFEEQDTAIIIPTAQDLQAGFAEDTRTYVENGKYLRWHEDDRLTAFYGNTLNRQYKFMGKTGANSGTFSLVPSGELGTGNTLDRIYAIYPYNEMVEITDEGKISLILPAVQSYAENSFGRGANTMIATTENLEDTFLAFKNACGYLKLKLYNTDGAIIKSIEVKGNNSEKIAGTATATISFGEVPQLIMADEATTTVTIDCGEGATLGTTAEAATEFWVVLPETTFEGGITITVTDTEGGVFEKSTDKEVVITRNEIKPMAALNAEFEKGESIIVPPNNEIWYTSVDGAIVIPNKTDVFGATIVSNTYENGKGIIKFDADITMIGAEAFYKCSSLTSIAIPNSATYIRNIAFRYCSNLISAIIGEGVTFIASCAFGNCSSLIKVYCKSTSVPALQYTNAFHLNATGRKIYVPVSLITEYIWSDYWIEFANDIIPYDFDNGREVKILPNNEIWYMSTAKVEPYATDVFGANIISNEWDSATGKGVITFDGDVTEIGMRAFLYCQNMTSIIIPDSVISIGRESFYDCKALTNVIISNGVQSIGMYAFCSCDNLKSVVIPDSVITVADQAFAKCENLVSVVIGRGLKSIGSQQFYQSRSLKNVYCKPTTPPSGNGGDWFFDNASDRKIYVPRDSVDAYKSASGWSSYASVIEVYDF